MDPQVIVGVNKSLTGVLTCTIGWGSLLILVVLIRNFIIAGISRAFIQVFESADDRTRETLIRFLVDKNLTVPEIYENLKKNFEGK